jgi:hypothetical protein
VLEGLVVVALVLAFATVVGVAGLVVYRIWSAAEPSGVPSAKPPAQPAAQPPAQPSQREG